MVEINPPNVFHFMSSPTIFLAGSIEMGEAENWQDRVIGGLERLDGTIFNPRRKDWDSKQEQSKDNDYFREQVEWELRGLEQAQHIFLYLSPGTKSPISLLELGLFYDHPGLVVCCPEGFWRRGNVDIVCSRYGIRQMPSIHFFVKEVTRIYSCW